MPKAWRDKWGVRRYGFHGLSHAYASRRAAEMVGGAGSGGGGGAGPGGTERPLRLVNCHLGAGASLAAVSEGVCVDTTMGFTPLEGLVMATRSGTVDPGLVLWLAQQHGLSPATISDQLEHSSGLAGLAGTADMRQVLAAEAAGGADAALALGVYLHRSAALVASMVASLGGLDVLTFTAGVGRRTRRPFASGRLDVLAFLGVVVDPGADAVARPDCEVTGAGASVRTLVIAAREDLEIARGARSVLSA